MSTSELEPEATYGKWMSYTDRIPPHLQKRVRSENYGKRQVTEPPPKLGSTNLVTIVYRNLQPNIFNAMRGTQGRPLIHSFLLSGCHPKDGPLPHPKSGSMWSPAAALDQLSQGLKAMRSAIWRVTLAPRQVPSMIPSFLHDSITG